MIFTLTPAITAAGEAPVQTALALVGILVLLLLVIQKDMSGEGASADSRAQQFRQALDVAVVPLLVVFRMIITLRVVEALIVRY